MKTNHDWRSGRYHIEPIGKGLWALVIEDSPGRTVLELTSDSLSGCKVAAQRIDARRHVRTTMIPHLSRAAAAVVIFAAAVSLVGWWSIPAICVAAYLGLSSSLAIIELVTGSAWNRVPERYQ